MITSQTSPSFSLTQQSAIPRQLLLHVHIPHGQISIMYQQALASIKRDIHTYGFARGATPESYIAHTYKPLLIDHLKHFFMHHAVHALLHKGIAAHKIIALHMPRSRHVLLDPDAGAQFTFSVRTSVNPVKNEWKKLHFKAPGRKNYKDLDRQVEFFLQEEEKKRQDSQRANEKGISFHDWVCFIITLVDAQHQGILAPLEQKVWIKIGEEEADQQAQALFLGKKVGNSFVTDHIFFQDTVSENFTTHYLFNVTIVHHAASDFFDIERFKMHFRLKSAKETHQKLIEVFSYRHDISQRREMVDKLFKLLFYHYPLDIDSDIVAQQEKLVLARVQENPDYHVYKNQSDFRDKVTLLAQNQIKDRLFIDGIAHQENIQATDEDVLHYLHFFKRPRMKEFIYFDIPQSQVNDQEVTLCHEEIRRACRREKTLNHVLYYLTKKA